MVTKKFQNLTNLAFALNYLNTNSFMTIDLFWGAGVFQHVNLYIQFRAILHLNCILKQLDKPKKLIHSHNEANEINNTGTATADITVMRDLSPANDAQPSVWTHNGSRRPELKSSQIKGNIIISNCGDIMVQIA